MPKDTFFNLPEDKSKRIINAAIEEFAEYSFEQASINRIIAASGISKGSFYQYFDDKKDLYSHMFYLIGQEKIKYMSPVLANPFNHGFFEVMHGMFESGLEYAKSSPLYMKIGLKLFQARDSQLYKEIVGTNEGSALQIYEQLIIHGQKTGELRESLDTRFTAKILYNMSLSIMEYEEFTTIEELESGMMTMLDKLMDLLTVGMERKE